MSRSQVIAERLKSREGFRRSTAIMILLLTLGYLSWRLTIFSDNWIFSLAFFVSEILAFLLTLVMVFGVWNYRHRVAIAPKPDRKVDVFLPVYKEPLDMIRQTVRAAKNIRYPHTTYLLDDGKRDELRQLAEELGVRYLRRPDNNGAKAGNMNHALKHATGDFIFVFDADHIAQAESIDALLGFFEDDRVGLVITPQECYNLNGLQFMHHGKGRLWHDQSRFYNVVQGCKDAYNCATSCGTGVAYRRKGIDEVGGFPELTVTEDMHVTLLLHERGYKSVYFNEPIAYGVTPADLADYYRTRERWAHGNLHVLQTEKPWKSKNLSWVQRLSYTELGVIYLECWQQLLIFLVPVLSLLFAWQPFEITPVNVMIVMGFPLCMIVLQDEQGCGMNRNWTSQLFAIARMPVQMVSWSACFGRRLQWRVSKKNLEGVFDWRLVSPQLALSGISLIALGFGIYKIPDIESTGPISGILMAIWERFVMGNAGGSILAGHSLTEVLAPGYSWDLLIISSFWVMYNGSRSTYWLLDYYQRTRRTHQFYRFEIPILIEESSGKLHRVAWISETELKVWHAHPPCKNRDAMNFKLWLPSGPLPVSVRVTAVDDSGYEADILWSEGGQAARDTLCDALLSVDWHAEIHEREGYFPTLIEQGFQRLRLKPKPALPEWHAGLMGRGGDSQPSLVLIGALPKQSPSQLVGFGEQPEWEEIEVRYPGQNTHRMMLGKPLPLQGWCTLGLNGRRHWKSTVSKP